MSTRIALLCAALLLGAQTTHAATWTWDAKSADVSRVELSRFGGDRSTVVVGPVLLPEGLSDGDVATATVEVQAGSASGGESAVLEVYRTAVAPGVAGWTAESVAWVPTGKGVRVINTERSVRIPITEIVREWLRNPDLPRYLVIGALGDPSTADTVTAEHAIGGDTLLRVSIHHVD